MPRRRPERSQRAGFDGYAGAMRRIERLINLIAALLDAEYPLTAEDIRERIAGYEQGSQEAFRRAFERDKEHIRAMGIPLETRSTGTDSLSEQPDGYIISKDRYYLPELDLEADELAALRLAADSILGAGEQAESGLLKLSVDIPDGPAPGPRVRWGADIAAEQPHLGPLYGAVIDRRAVRFGYRASSGEERERTIEGYALLHRRGNWYLVGRDVDGDSIRTFKLSRVTSSVEVTDGSYQIPHEFEASEYLAGEAFEIGADQDRSTARVSVDPRLRWWVEQNMSAAASRATEDGSVELDLPVGNLEALVSWAVGFGDGVEILDPPEAREAMMERLAPYLNGTA